MLFKMKFIDSLGQWSELHRRETEGIHREGISDGKWLRIIFLTEFHPWCLEKGQE